MLARTQRLFPIFLNFKLTSMASKQCYVAATPSMWLRESLRISGESRRRREQRSDATRDEGVDASPYAIDATRGAPAGAHALRYAGSRSPTSSPTR